MILRNYIVKSIRYYRKQHLAVFAATLLATAVLTGALIVGDSVKFSLQSIVDARLGKIETALQAGDRFFRSALSKEITNKTGVNSSALLVSKGIAINPENEKRISDAQILGVDENFWAFGGKSTSQPLADEVIVSQNVLENLKLNIGDILLLRVAKNGVIPLNAPFVSHEELSVSFRLKIIEMADDAQMGRFSLQSNQAQPNNIFINRDFLAAKLGLSGKANVLLSEYPETDSLNTLLRSEMKLADYGLNLQVLTDSITTELTSDRIFIDKSLSDRFAGLPMKHQGILTYLVNKIVAGKNETPYSFVAAVAPELLNQELNSEEIIINQWLADDLNIQSGDSLTLKYFVIGPLRRLTEIQKVFRVKDVIPVETATLNRSLMPEFPGLADAGSCSDWEAGVPIDLSKIRDTDEKYWDTYKGTPKAYINQEAGQAMWENSFGSFTAIRFHSTRQNEFQLVNQVLRVLDPADINLRFQPVRKNSTKAANNGVDFGELFLSMSFFIIAAAILLTMLIHALHLASRTKESGILSGLGFNRNQIIKIRIIETMPGIVAGGMIGAMVGVLYNYGLIYGLNTVWNGAVHTSQLQVYILPKTLIIGAISGISLSLLTVLLVSRHKMKYSVKDLITHAENLTINNQPQSKWIVSLITILAFLSASSMVLYSLLNNIDQHSALFLGAGAFFMIGCVGSFSLWMDLQHPKTVYGISLIQFASINLGRNPGRSIAVIVLLALGTFTTLITGANRNTFFGSESDKSSGTGGYRFWAELTVPVLFDLNSSEGRENLGLNSETAMKETQFLQFHLLGGDDASCLNLNQVQQPKILGVNPEILNRRASFSFDKLTEGLDRKTAWLALNKYYGENIVPAFADQTVITWGLMKKIGDTLYYKDEAGKDLKILLIGGLNASVFQGNLLISEKQFLKHFPSVGGSRVMLIDAPESDTGEYQKIFEQSLVDYGLHLETTSHRLAAFYSVTNTYLSVFMLLGGLGVILGTIGLGIVLTRNLIDRRSEIALLQAIGFNRKTLFRLIFIENLWLLIAGMLIGILSAVVGMLPSILSSSFSFQYGTAFLLIGIIFLSGLCWIYFPLKLHLKSKLTEDLRSE